MSEHTSETRHTSLTKLSIITIVSVIVVVVVMLGINEFLLSTNEDLSYLTAPRPQNPELLELHAQEDKLLNNYEVVDEAKGIYRIPIERAMELIAEEHRTTE